uniref:DUF4136 domain-containing protein n=1 Tax=Castellaniella defragrans TaxID=75697 RepID=UPI003342C423
MFLMTRISHYARIMRLGAAILGAVLLGGCASTFSAEVTRYQQWPSSGTVGAYYRILAPDSEKNDLQFQAYADMVRAAIGATGLVEARQPADARFDVRLTYGTQITHAWVARPIDPFYYPGGFYGFRGPYFGMHHHWGGWGFGPSVESVPVDLYQHSLTVTIQDRQHDNQEVYRATAVSIGRTDNLTAVMPYLARAIFDQFPGHNAQVIDVEYPLGD